MASHVQTSCRPRRNYRAHIGLRHWPCTQERGRWLWRADIGRHRKRAEEVPTLQAQSFLTTRQASMTPEGNWRRQVNENRSIAKRAMVLRTWGGPEIAHHPN